LANLSNIWPVSLSDSQFIAYLEKNELQGINSKVIYIWFEFKTKNATEKQAAKSVAS
jgi:hypothetical protein